MRGLAWVLIALAALAVVASYAGTLALRSDIAQHRVVMACYAEYDAALREALIARDVAQHALLAAAAEPGPTPPGVLERYLEALAAHPLPADNYCLPRSP
jgi:hypothetical protein